MLAGEASESRTAVARDVGVDYQSLFHKAVSMPTNRRIILHCMSFSTFEFGPIGQPLTFDKKVFFFGLCSGTVSCVKVDDVKN